MLDLILRNCNVIDVLNKKISNMDIGITAGKIVKIGTVTDSAAKEIDVKGKYVSPGFIDIHMHEEGIYPGGYDIANTMLNMGVTTALTGNCGDNKQGIQALYSYIDNNGCPVNYMSMIGHNYLRYQVGNNNRYAKSTYSQIEQMKILIKEAVDFGAMGVSFGFEYAPGCDTDEAISVCESIKGRNDLLLSAHYRKDSIHAVESVDEMCDISAATGIPMQISHISSLSAYGNMTETLKQIEKRYNEGVNVMGDSYPYTAFSTYIGSAVFDDGCFEQWNTSYDCVMLTEEPYRGVICDEKTFRKVRKEYPNMLVVAHAMNEKEIIEAINHPLVMIASDGLYNNHQGHPRGAGTFPRVIGKYVRDQKVVNLYDAINKMTLMPAKRLGLNTKGLIKEGYDADIVVFDYDTIIDKATFTEPQISPDGIEYVIVNGSLAIDNGKVINNRLGKFIKRQ